MKKSTKTVAASTAALLIAGSLAGCGGDGKLSSEALTYWASMDSASTQTLSSYSEMLMYQEIEKATGVKVEFIHPVAGSTGNESFNTLLASNDLPDMIETHWTSYAGGAQAAIDDGVIIALDEYLEDWAPNYYKYVEGEYNDANDGRYKAQSTTERGQHYGFHQINIGTSRGFAGLVVREDLIKKWGMDVPTTISDWEAIFAKAKAEGFTKPFTIASGHLDVTSATHTFNTAYDVGRSFYLEDDEVVFAPFQPGFKDFVGLLADWTAKGYIDKNFVTNQTTDVEGNMTNGFSMACYGWIGSTMGKILPAMETRDPEFSLIACPYPVMNDGDVCRFQEVQPEAKDPSIAITTACEDIESAMKWADYIYGDEGSLLQCFGVEGDTYTVEEIDGETHYIYTDKIQKPETVGATSVNGALYKFFRPANGPGLNQHPDYLNGYYPYQCQKDALVTWNKDLEIARENKLPTLSYTTDESSRKAVLNQDYQATFQTSINEIILGNKSMTEYDTIIADAKKNAYDELLKIENAAYDRYQNKLK